MGEAGFLTAIRDAPHDTALRFVYADWLEDQGDPRAELVRIEEEMLQLPVFADRYWQLKPRRNRLRAKAGGDWLQVMRYGTDCQPLFCHGVPEGWKERWRLIREFVDRWHRHPLPDVGGRTDDIQEVEDRLGRTLPPSVREWVAFAHDVRPNSDFHFVLRDIYQMRELEGLSAISLLLQCEGDYHWAVRHTDLRLADPPVYGFHWDVENEPVDENRFVQDGPNPIAPLLTSFAFGYVLAYSRGTGGGFSTTVADSHNLVRDLETTFPVKARFGDQRLFEAENLLVRVSPDDLGTGVRLTVAVARALTPEAIPAFLWDYTRNGGAFHGMFIPNDNRNIPF